MRAKIFRQAQQGGFFLHMPVVCAAGKVHGNAVAAQHGKQLLRAGHQPIGGGVCAVRKAGAPPIHCAQQAPHIFVLIFLRVFCVAAHGVDALGKLDALIDGLLAGVYKDEFLCLFVNILIGPARRTGRGGKFVCKIGNHDALPALADEAERAIKIEHGISEAAPRAPGAHHFQRFVFHQKNFLSPHWF